MGVIDVQRGWSGVTGERRIGEEREYTAVYHVETDSKYDQAEVIITYFSLAGPYIGYPYTFGNDFDLGATCDSIRPKRRSDHERIWDVEFHYATQPAEKDGEDEDGKKTGNPLQFRDEIDVSHSNITRPVEKAWRLGGFKGAAFLRYPIGSFGEVVNSAGVPFNPGVERQDSLYVIRITKHSANFPAVIQAYLMHLNDRNWTINKPAYNFSVTIQKHHGQFANADTQFNFQNNVKYWKTTYEIHYDPVNDFNVQILDRGTTRRANINDPDGKGGLVGFFPDGSAMDVVSFADAFPLGTPMLSKVTDPFGQPVTEPVLFNGDGQPLRIDKGEQPVYLDYRIYPEGDLSNLNL